MPNTENRKNSNKKPTLQEHSQTVIIPQLTPEMLEQARRAAEQGKTAEQIEQEALAAAPLWCAVWGWHPLWRLL